MTRKKFIKSLMAAGAHRNTAAMTAAAARAKHIPKAVVLGDLLKIRAEFEWVGQRSLAQYFNDCLQVVSLLALQECKPAPVGGM